jgi:ligand-binding sensor protein
MKSSEIIDIEILQKIQDCFSDAFELPAIIYDKKEQYEPRNQSFKREN